MRNFWKTDGFSALVIAALFTVAAFQGTALLETLERLAYDVGVRSTSVPVPGDNKLVVIAVDDDSIARLGRWPWPRSLLAQTLDQVAAAGPKAIGLHIFFSEAQTDPGLTYLRQLNDFIVQSNLPRLAPAESEQIAQFLQQAEEDLDSDRRLATAIGTASNVLMPMYFGLGEPFGKPDQALPAFVTKTAVRQVVAPVDGPHGALTAVDATYPLPLFGEAALGIGHLNVAPDVDGAIRKEPLVLNYYGEHFPSFALLLAARSLNLNASDIGVDVGRNRVQLGRLILTTDDDMQIYTGYAAATREDAPYTTYPFHEVQSGKVPATVFKDRIVLIGTTAVGIGSTQVTPVAQQMHGAELTAHVVRSILDQRFFTRPSWAPYLEMGLFAFVLVYLMFALPRVGAAVGAGISLLLFAGLIAGGIGALLAQHMWLKTVTPALFLLSGHLWLTTKRFLWTEKAKTKVESDSAHTNRMLGLAFQGQGQLDMAMDKFRTLPIDDSVLDLIYNVALDFERKRQFNKATAAYDYILKHNPKFKDTLERRKRALAAESTVVIGGKSAQPGGTLVLDVDQKPTLGRYQVEKELGRGAMGAVYLGRDPKINRVVAIKTMALSQEFEEHELAEVKSRFFREAETAGRLNHPNIVTIYDAGDEQDLAYIAMEFLQGNTLEPFTKAEQLLPVPQALEMVAKIADALDYAHKQDVVHRDIKPANIMYDARSNALKITDFGIARITASSRTKTGVIMGTPSYMSPEQLAGKHVDGRSDLFSLGVMLFELLTGKQPFTGDSMAALMFRIANEPHPDITTIRSDLPGFMRAFMDKALDKEPEKRFQSGADVKRALQQCLQHLGARSA